MRTVKKIMKKDFHRCAKDPKVCNACDFRFYCRGKEITMPDIYDPDRGLIISLTDDDYENYQDGKLSGRFLCEANRRLP